MWLKTSCICKKFSFRKTYFCDSLPRSMLWGWKQKDDMGHCHLEGCEKKGWAGDWGTNDEIVSLKEGCLVFQVLEEGGQVSGENIETNPVPGRNLFGFCKDAKRIRTFHLKKIVITIDLWQIPTLCVTHQYPRLWIEDVVEVFFAVRKQLKDGFGKIGCCNDKCEI